MFGLISPQTTPQAIMADAGDNSWQTQVFRQKVIGQIEEAMLRAGNPTNKTSTEMENHVFQRAKSREEYLGLVARVILHVREFNQKKKGMGGMGGPIAGLPGATGIQDPINALQNLTKAGLQTAPAGTNLPMVGQPLGGQPLGGQRAPFMSYQGPNCPIMGQRPMQPGPQPMNQGLGNPLTLQTSMPSPLSNQPSSGPGASPAGFVPSPSPQGPGVDPSPRPSAGAPSPGATLNTPGNPSSAGASASPAPVSRTAEEQAYMDKWRQLQKYIEPLKRMINRINEDEGKERDLNKMKNLLDILSDSTKRLPMTTLLKCEAVLEKLDFPSRANATTTSSSTTTVTTPVGQPEGHLFQPLLNSLAEHVQNPLVNHTLYRTFGPAVNALHGTPIRAPSPPAKRRKHQEESDEKIPTALIGEIARLDRRFRVKLDPLYHSGSKSVHLVCSLDDKHLPTVPPISVTIPENYPETSPTCGAGLEDYDVTPFLQSIQHRLGTQLLTLPHRFSLTQMLDTWEMSVRQACAPRVK